jgi:hypothetical protein
MKAHRVPLARLTEKAIAGRVLVADLPDAAGAVVFRKGAILQPQHARRLRELGPAELHLIQMEPGDLHEEEAGQRIAAAVLGRGLRLGGVSGGAWLLHAQTRGILQVDPTSLARLNMIEGLSISTLFNGQVVDEGETVTRVKIVPLVIAGERVIDAEKALRGMSPVLGLRAFQPSRVAALVRDTLPPERMSRFREALGEKLAWLGSELMEPLEIEGQTGGSVDEEVAAALRQALDRGADVVVVAGSRPMDPLDPTFAALERLGASLERHGVPAHPGSLFWIARLQDVPVLGMPNCGLFSRATVFDLVLPRILAGERIGSAELAEVGHGGLLTRDLAFRFPPYRAARARGEAPADE